MLLLTPAVLADLSSNARVFASGLNNPRGPQTPPPLGPFTGAFTGRISRINPAGYRQTVVDGLPLVQTSALVGPTSLESPIWSSLEERFTVCSKLVVQRGTSMSPAQFFASTSMASPTVRSASYLAFPVNNKAPDFDAYGNPYGMTRLGDAGCQLRRYHW